LPGGWLLEKIEGERAHPERATIKAHHPAPHRPRPYGIHLFRLLCSARQLHLVKSVLALQRQQTAHRCSSPE
jgi:hypothetical protein